MTPDGADLMEPGLDEPPLYDPFSPAVALDPYPVYQQLRDEHPVYRSEERDLWVLSRFADVEGALRDPSTFSSANGVNLGPTMTLAPMLLTMDPPQHDDFRRLVSRAFTPRRVAEMEPRIRELAAGLLDEIGEDPVDIMGFASALPTMVIAELLGIPGEDHQRFRAWVESTITIDPAEIIGDASKGAGIGELLAYLQAVIDERRLDPRDDMVSALLDAQVDGHGLRRSEILGFTLLLLAAGFETTKNLIGNGIDVLAGAPDVRRSLVADQQAIAAAVEEVLRFESPVSGLSRTTTRDVDLHGTTIPEGARVFVLYGSANRDERAFAHPDRFDPTRGDERHLAFGHGIHYCLGAALARLEARVAFDELLDRLPDFEVVDRERLLSPYIRGFASLTIAR